MHERGPRAARLARAAVVVLASGVFAACASSPKASSDGERAADGSIPGAEPYTDTPAPPEAAIGAFLVDLDGKLRAWSNLTLTAQSQSDYRKWRVLEADLTYRASNRREELLEQLESGPPNNRVVAAMALGFVEPAADAASVVSPLLNALEDAEPEVVNNAIVALGMLAAPDTPIAPVARLVGAAPESRMRVNAALTVRKLVEAGAPWDPSLVVEARHGLIDSEPGVVAQCCLLLGWIGDGECIDVLSPLLRTEPALVCSAAAKALALIGTRLPEKRGACARALVAGFEHAPEALKPRIQRALIELAGRNYGDDAEAWADWAQSKL